MQPDYAEASNSLGALLAQSGEVPAAMERFRAALQAKPDFPDALNNLGFALFQTGQAAQAFELYEKALASPARLPGGAQQPRHLLRAAGRSRARADRTSSRRWRSGPATAKRPTTSPWSSAPGATARARSRCSRKPLEENPAFEMTYVTLSRIYLRTGRRREAVQVLEKLLQRNPKSALGLEVLRQAQTGN